MTEGQTVVFSFDGRHETVGIVSMISADRQRILVDVAPEGRMTPVWKVVYADEIVRIVS